jgi:hypothetical protein
VRSRLLAGLTACAAFFAAPAPAYAAPPPVQAWYMYGTTLGGLQSNAYSHGCNFAQNHPGGNRLMVLDFGAARQIDSDTWGALDFSGVRFSNPEILSALESAADGHHNCWTGTGSTIVAYGNSNYDMSGAGMSTSDAWWAGYYQSERAQNLSNYQQSQGYNMQSADAASDMEPSWDGNLITKQLVNGDTSQGFALYWNYGSADGCPSSGDSGSCNNGWDVGDVAYVSYKGLAVPIPEIYYTVNADQWTVVRHWWDNYSTGGFTFFGTTATTGVGLSPGEGWNALEARNPDLVLYELSCFC